MIINNISQLEAASRSVNINRASGRDLDALSRMFGYANPRILPDNYWKECVKILAYGAKGTPGIVFDFAEAFFDFWSQGVTYETTIVSKAIEAPVDVEFNCAYTNRLVRVYYALEDGSFNDNKSLIHYVTGVSAGGELQLSTCSTSYWAGCVQEDSHQVKVKVLPFLIDESKPGVVKLIVDSAIFITPSHYLLDDASTPRGILGYNTHLLDFFGVEEERFANLDIGLYGIYLNGEDVGGEFSYLIKKLVPAGVRVAITARTWCDESLPFNSISSIKQGSSATGGIDWPVVTPFDN